MLPPLPHGELFSNAWTEWMAYRKEAKKPLTSSTILAQLTFLTTLNEHDAILSIRTSIQQGWAGLFAPRQGYGKQSTAKQLTQDDHNSF